jgi:hypothetical protein
MAGGKFFFGVHLETRRLLQAALADPTLMVNERKLLLQIYNGDPNSGPYPAHPTTPLLEVRHDSPQFRPDLLEQASLTKRPGKFTDPPKPEAFNLPTDAAIRWLGSVTIFKRLRHHGWIRPLEPSAPGRTSLYPVSGLLAAQLRMEQGELPPPLPSEISARARCRVQLAERSETTLKSVPGLNA